MYPYWKYNCFFKSLIPSKCVHIFLLLPLLENFSQKLNTPFFQFLWNNKQDRIKRDTLCSDYFKGGLKMANVCVFIKSLKINWIRRIAGRLPMVNPTKNAW